MSDNVVSAAYKSVQPNRTQAYLRSQLVADVIAKAEFGNVTPAQTIKFPYMNSVKVQDYAYQTGNARTGITMVTDSYTIDQAKTAVSGYDRIQNLQIQNPSWVSMLEEEMGYQLARNVDQTVIQKGVSNAFTIIAGGSIGAGDLLKILAETAAKMREAQRMAGMLYLVMDPLRAALLPQMNASSGFVKADDALVSGFNGFEGNEAVGFKILISNDLKYTVVLTLAVNPTAGDNFRFGGRTWTFVANGTAAAVGDISIGGNAAATQVIVRDALNGTGTPGASTYIDLASDDRIAYQNSQVTCAAFAVNVATITKFGRMDIVAVFTSGSNSFGTETSNMLAGVAGAIDMTMLQAPFYEELQAMVSPGTVTHAKDMIMTTLWGSGVWHRRARSLAAISFNA